MKPLELSRPTGTVAMLSDGVLNIRKARGCTSHDVVAKLRRLLGMAKVGHAGTLDPEATGVLPVLCGKATRVAEHLAQWDKEYHTVLRLGESTDTQDATGVVLATRPVGCVTEAMVRQVLSKFVGPLLQVPPMYSAVKVGGVPLYKTARAGRTVEREARAITVHRIEVMGIEGRDVSLAIDCSKGTYIRTLCAEIGEALGFGGHIVFLERVRVGPLALDDARTVDEIGVLASQDRLSEVLLSMDEVLADLPSVAVPPAQAMKVLHGVPVPVSTLVGMDASGIGGLPVGQVVKLKDMTGRLLGLGRTPPGVPVAQGRNQPESVMRVVKVFVEP